MHACVLASSDLASEPLQRLLDKGYTHYELEEAFVLMDQPIYSFYKIPSLEVRLREHVEAYFHITPSPKLVKQWSA